MWIARSDGDKFSPLSGAARDVTWLRLASSCLFGGRELLFLDHEARARVDRAVHEEACIPIAMEAEEESARDVKLGDIVLGMEVRPEHCATSERGRDASRV